MCRNIKKLRQSGKIPTEAELNDAALQFIRKISGYPAPSLKNQKAFNRAVAGVAREARKMFENFH
jgi:hypothetical protein